ncbi:MAG: polysaccharide deacetylase family protein [Thermoplasmatota archaeon]
MNKPYFLITLDTELGWGPTSIEGMKFLKRNEKEAKKVIPKILSILKENNISATWAIVGHLFLEECSKEDCLTWKNKKDNYDPKWYEDPYSNKEKDPLFYCPDLIEDVLNSKIKQEIGYHSFSHPKFNQINKDMAEDEIKMSKKIEKDWNIELKSFVYPTDEKAYVDILGKYDFNIYRRKPIWYSDRTHFKNLIEGLGNLNPPPVTPVFKNGLWSINTSMIYYDSLIPFFPIEARVPFTSLPCAKMGLNRAIKEKSIFHIFLHPWNLLTTEKLEYNLNSFLKYVSKRINNNNIKNVTMNELVDELDENFNHKRRCY